MRLVNYVTEHWQDADEGIWEVRGGRREFLYSRLMCWVAVDRGIRLADRRSLPYPFEAWRSTRDAIYHDIMHNFWDSGRQTFVQHKGTTAVDASTLRVRLKAPSSSLPFRVSVADYARMGMQSKAAFDKVGEAGLGRMPVGTGPMRFKQWVTDDRLTLERNGEYWRNGADGKPLPYIDSFVSRYLPDLTVGVPDIQSGQIMAAENMPANQLSVLRANPRLRVVVWPWAVTTYFMMGFNIYRPPFDNLKVRQAALYAINRDAMAKTLGYGEAQPAYYPDWTPSLAGYDDKILKYRYDPTKVKQLLNEAGYTGGIETDLLVIQREPESTIGQFAAEMWTSLGIKTTLRTLERLTWITDVRSMNFQACFWRNTPPEADPAQIVSAVSPNSPTTGAGSRTSGSPASCSRRTRPWTSRPEPWCTGRH